MVKNLLASDGNGSEEMETTGREPCLTRQSTSPQSEGVGVKKVYSVVDEFGWNNWARLWDGRHDSDREWRTAPNPGGRGVVKRRGLQK